jgi:hypothetical protein
VTKLQAKFLGQLLIAASVLSFFLWLGLNFFNTDTRMVEWLVIIGVIALTGIGFLVASLKLTNE